MNQLTTYQKYIIKRYLLIIFISFLRTFYLNYNIFKMFRNGIEYNEKYQEIKEIQRKNILLNGIELKKWTKLSENQKEYFINNEQTKLEDTSKFKVKYTTKYKKSIIDENNINEQYNFIVFVKTIFQNTFYTVLSLILFFSLPIFVLYKFYKHHIKKIKPYEKFYNLPLYLKDLSSTLNDNGNQKYIDKFIGYDEDNKQYLFKTQSILQKNLYEKHIKEIENYLNISNLKITQTNLIIKLEEKQIRKFVEFNEEDYQQDKLFLGEREHGEKIHLNILGLKHTIIIGESGSGKSVFIQNILLSIFKNLNLYEKIYLVDFKLVEMSRYKNKNPKIEVISGINQFTQKIKEIEELMWERYKYMEEHNLTNFNGFGVLVFIDEFRSLENNSLDKKEKDKMVKSLIELLQKRRRRKIFLIFRGQKRDTQNINSSIVSNIMNRILLKTTNNDNITKIGGNVEELESNGISINEIKNFNRGRLFYKDGDSGENFLIQSPFFDVENEQHSTFMFSLITNNKEVKKIKKEIKEIKEIQEKRFYKEEINIEELEDNHFNDLEDNHFNDLEEQRLKKWKDTNNLEDKKEQSQKRKILFQVKKLIEKNELEERKNILNTL